MARGWTTEVHIPAEGRLSQLPVLWCVRPFLQRRRNLTTHYPVPKFRLRGALPPYLNEVVFQYTENFIFSQAIKSFSIRDGWQHITLAFPFMEELVKRFAEPLCSTASQERPVTGGRFVSITPALLFDRCPEVIHGFETLVTLVPTTLRYVCNT
jgi:hypothetical protein